MNLRAFFQSNESRMNLMCNESCRCDGGVLQCISVSCFDDQYCGLRGNEHGCHWIGKCGCRVAKGAGEKIRFVCNCIFPKTKSSLTLLSIFTAQYLLIAIFQNAIEKSSLYLLYDIEACNKFAKPIPASLRLRATHQLISKKCCSGEEVGNNTVCSI